VVTKAGERTLAYDTEITFRDLRDMGSELLCVTAPTNRALLPS
jgi:hypothetical protein